MIIFPAIDIQNGKVVRLRKGKKDNITIFGDDPLEVAHYWKDQGAEWLHIVDLDGAFEGRRANAPIIGKIAAECGLKIQAGGGIRQREDAAHYLDAGVERVIIGTTALEDPSTFRMICASYPGRVGVSLDAEKGELKTRGWIADSGLNVIKAVPELEKAGAAFIIYTDIERDGMQNGVNLQALAEILSSTSLPVIAAGGVTTLADIQKLYKLASSGNLEGAISGRALYEKTLHLPDAINWLASQ